MRYGEANRIQAELLFCALGAGFVIGVLYGVLMLLRRLFRHSFAAVAVEDALFCVAAAFLTFLFLFDCNSGTVRTYLLLSECAGFLAVRASVGKIIAKKHKKHLQGPS